ncbi:MAG TPA: 50S ribosomal protein L24 [Nitrospirales bacterium]|nr:50S ribosomal protein L24 [Nitrospirales bacterium]HIA13376.1 50S ribosomal protein L24 [Nitrospirales bacterium]HIB53826.1 50S ribosomal protein L24 [Nitrospirales bacterium]
MSETRSKFKIRKGDTVVVIAGKDKGKSGKVLSVIEKKPAVVVEKLNIVKRHTKPSQQNRQGGILERESPIHFSNVMLLCPNPTCHKPVRTGMKWDEDGQRLRVCRACGVIIEKT